MNFLESRLVRLDIPNTPSVVCTIFSNSNKVGVLSSTEYSDPSNCLLIPIQGIMRIVVSSLSKAIGSVSFPSTLINESGCLWLPIFAPAADDYIENLPEELSSPKILMYFEKKTPEETENKADELAEIREKIRTMTVNYQDFIKISKGREITLMKSLEDKDAEIQDYVQQLNKAQSRIFTLIAEKRTLGNQIAKVKAEYDYSESSELKEELENVQQELIKSENKTEQLIKRMEDISGDWNFIEEESQFIRESELVNQIAQLKNEIEVKNTEIAALNKLNRLVF
jgi:hypothetical protein